jgi:hypothetical protein
MDWLYAPIPIMTPASISFAIKALPYNDESVNPRSGSRRYSKNGPVITIVPRITTGIVENLGIRSDSSEALIYSSL